MSTENATSSQNVWVAKSCPFCGGKAKVSTELSKSPMAACDNPDCPIYDIGLHLEEWNKRDAWYGIALHIQDLANENKSFGLALDEITAEIEKMPIETVQQIVDGCKYLVAVCWKVHGDNLFT